MKKGIYLLGLLSVIMIASFYVPGKTATPTCDNYGVVYLKKGELGSASILTDKAGIVVIPELNQVQMRTDLVDCKNIDPTQYLSEEIKQTFSWGNN